MTSRLDLKRMYRTAVRIREVESRIAFNYPEGEMRCPVHLSIGQEIPSSLIELFVQDGDKALSTHRAHAHYLAFGGNLSRMIAEIYGKVTGCSRGRGGSMHLIDLERGFLGSSAIVGNSIPLGVGAAFAKQLSKENSVVYIFLGDGACEEGSFYESVNFAAVHKLPVVFVLENNQYSVYTNLSRRQPADRSISSLSESLGLKSASVSDWDIENAFKTYEDLINYTRNGNGPSLIEISTYRKLEHCGPNDDDILGYRPESELDLFKKRDLVEELRTKSAISDAENVALMSVISDEIDRAFSFAKESRFPTFEEAVTGVYAK